MQSETDQNLGLGVSIQRMYHRLLSVQVQFGSFDAFLIFDDLISWKRLVRAKRTKIWASGVSIQCIQSSFDKCFRFSATLHLEKRWSQGQTDQNLGLRVRGKYLVYIDYRILLTVKCSSSVWGYSVHFLFLMTLYLRNSQSQSKTDQNLSVWGKYLVYIKYF